MNNRANNVLPTAPPQRLESSALVAACLTVDESPEALHLSEPGYLCMRKTATCIRELETVDARLSFKLVERKGSSGHRAHHESSAERTAVHVAECANFPHPDLRRCIVKTTFDASLAENEWFHLTSYRSPAFPTPFVFGTAEEDADAPDTNRDGAAAERPTGRRYALAMEYVEGPTLQQLIDQGFGTDHGPAPVEKALEIMSPLAGSFKELSLAMHPFVHRDVKPENIVVSNTVVKDTGVNDAGAAGTSAAGASGSTPTLRARLIDLGTSSHRHDGLQGETAGATKGYAPPELMGSSELSAAAQGTLDDVRIDTYSLAATMFSLVTGRIPRVGGGDELLAGELRHDAGTVSLVARAAAANLYAKHRAIVETELLDRLVAQAIEEFDLRFAALVTQALSTLQSQRPTPAEFFDALPNKYVASLVDDVQVLYLQFLVAGDDFSAASGAPGSALRTVNLSTEETVHMANTPLSDDYRYDGFLEDFHAAMAYYNNGQYEQAVPLLRKLDAAGDASSSYNLGVCYKDGLGGLERNDVRKLACWTKAAEAGHVVAMFNVGVCHEQGIGIAPSPEAQQAARMWYARAAEGGFPAAIDRMARYNNEKNDDESQG